MSEYAILLTTILTAVAIVGGLILGAIYFFYNSSKADTAVLRADIKRVDSKLDTKAAELDAKIDSEINGLRSEMQAGFARLDAKIDSTREHLDAKIDTKIDGLRTELKADIAGVETGLDAKIDGTREHLDAKIDTKTDDLHTRLDTKIEREINSLRSDLGGRIDTNTEKLAELSTEVQVHLRTHHLMSEIERITSPPEPRAEEEQAEEEANQPS